MGVFHEMITVRNVMTDSEPLQLSTKVDTGDTMLVIPGWLQERLQFPVIRTQNVCYANETTAERIVVHGVEITVCGRKGVYNAVIEPDKSYGLLGAIIMEELDLIPDPRGLKLYPNPRSPEMPMAEIE